VLGFEVRTYWGYGFRKSDPIVKGIFSPRTSDYFDTENKAAITRPEQAEDFVEALKPYIFNRKSQLPYAKLISK
jgi:hypothetical protein